jgi:hypothetical protein
LIIKRSTSSNGDSKFFLDDDGVTLISSPDIEDRSFHDPVKAYMGPENWPGAVK